MEVLERLVEATYTRECMGLLAQANLGIEKLRFLFRLAMDLRHLDLAATSTRRVRCRRGAATPQPLWEAVAGVLA